MHHATYLCPLQTSEKYLFELCPYTLLGILSLFSMEVENAVQTICMIIHQED